MPRELLTELSVVTHVVTLFELIADLLPVAAAIPAKDGTLARCLCNLDGTDRDFLRPRGDLMPGTKPPVTVPMHAGASKLPAPTPMSP